MPFMNRRSFLRSSLGLGALASFSASTAVTVIGQEPSRSALLRLGFLGMTHPHAAGKLKAVLNSKAYDLVGICDDRNSVRRRFADSPASFVSRKQLLGTAEVVAVESDVEDHAADARAALEAGCHVHLEKAPTASMRSFRDLVDLARSRKRLLQMGYMWRYHPAINAALEAARNGWLGMVYRVRATINTDISADQRAALAKFRGGMMFELGAHLIDPVVRLLGRPETVTAHLKQTGTAPDNLADNTLAVFEYPNALATISSATPQHGASAQRSLEIQGTNGTVRISPLEQPVFRISLARAAGPYPSGSQTVPMPPYARYVPELEDLADAIRSGRPLRITPEEDLLVHESLMRACDMEAD